MSGINKKLKAYVRYDGTGRIVGGGPIIQPSKPKDGNWKEIPMYKCCTPAGVSCNNFFINQVVGVGLDCVDQVYAVGSAIDSQCNSYLLSVAFCQNPNNPYENYQNGILQKFADNGDLIWQKGFDFDGHDNFTSINYQGLTIDKEGNPIAIAYFRNSEYFESFGLLKFNTNGNLLWNVHVTGDVDTYVRYLTSTVDSNNNIYILTYRSSSAYVPGACSLYLHKFSSSGVLLNTKIISKSDGYFNIGFIRVNSVGEICVTVTDYAFSRKSYIIKLDSSFNEIWNKSIQFPRYGDGIYGLTFDNQGNIIINPGDCINPGDNSTYGYVSLSPSGNINWATSLQNTVNSSIYYSGYIGLFSDSTNNIYSVNCYFSGGSTPGYSNPSQGDMLGIAKFSATGTFEWVYTIGASKISGPVGIYTQWYQAMEAGNLANNSITLNIYDSSDPYNSMLAKLPLTLVTGTYGDFTFTDMTNLWTPQSGAFTLNDDTINYSNGSTATETLTYSTFTQNTTVTKTVI